MKKLYAIVGSGRKNGYSQKGMELIKSRIPADWTLEVDRPMEMEIGYCLACDHCAAEEGACVRKDDMQEVYQKLAACDALLIVSPVYFNSAPAPLKALIDRCQVFFYHKLTGQPKKAYVLGFGGARSYETQFTGLLLNLEHVLKNINAQLEGTLFFPRTDAFPDALPAEEVRKIEKFADEMFL